MNTLVVYAHPWDGSFNHSVLSTVKELLQKQNKNIDLIDLNKDGFNPVMQQEDLKEFAKGNFADDLARDYVERLKKADELVLIFPIWWYGEPAILKGFYDKVFLKGHVYDQVDNKLKGILNINKATILTTASINKEIFKTLGDPINNVLTKGILGTVGIDNTEWIHCGTVHLEESRNKYLNDIENIFM